MLFFADVKCVTFYVQFIDDYYFNCVLIQITRKQSKNNIIHGAETKCLCLESNMVAFTKSKRKITHHLCPYGHIHWREEA